MLHTGTYRSWAKSKDLVSFNIALEETDCRVSASTNLEKKARKSISKYRSIIKKYISVHPEFLTSLEPLPPDISAPLIVKAMMEAAERASVGPMAAVAGAIAQFVAQDLNDFSQDIIIENGGDIFLKSTVDRIVGIYAGVSSLSGKIGIEIGSGDTPLGVSTSSGTVGHSLSFGKADAVLVLAEDAVLSDAVATAIGNLIITAQDIPGAIEHVKKIPGVIGTLIIKGDNIGAWGKLKICRTDCQT